MMQAKSAALMGFLTTLVLSSSAVLADLDIDVSVDRNVVAAGDTMTISGTITSHSGDSSGIEYRIAAVAPGARHGGERVIVCDSGVQTTGEDGAVSFECQIPTLAELEEMGVENAAERAVIPLKGGIVARDPATNESEREHDKALIINTDKFKAKFELALERLDAFIARAEEAAAKCDDAIARAEEAGVEDLIERCTEFQEKMRDHISKALEAQERINNALNSINDLSDFSFDDLKNAFVNFRDSSKDFTIDVKGIRDRVLEARADLERRVAKDIADRARERAKELREQAEQERKALKERIKQAKDEARRHIGDRIADIRDVRDVLPVAVRPADVEGAEAEEPETSETEDVEEEASEDNSKSETDSSGSGA